MEAWKKVLVDSTFLDSTHAGLSCVDCHGGDNTATDMAVAHTGMVADPSDSCAVCHPGESAPFEDSQHRQLTGYRELIATRAGMSELSPALEDMFEANCNTCHVTCGQCHISRPNSVGKGFLRGHEVVRRPSMTENCTACHGSRVGEEFRGSHAGVPADVHYYQGMQCVACHSAEEMHGHGAQGSTRYDVELAPRCEDCHPDVAQSNNYHQFHGDRVACQVCHSVEYKNCYSCHVGHGLEQPSELGFKIGRNPIQSARRPAEYVVVRHIPIAPDSYRDYIADLPGYTSLPTWKYATPHNIQKNTPQTADCTSSCHNNADLFLTADDLAGMSAEEAQANQAVIVEEIP